MKKQTFEVTTAELAGILKVSPRRIRQLVDRGMPRVSHGTYGLPDVLYWYALQWKEAQREKESTDDDPMAAEQLRLKRAQADEAELALARKRRALVPIEILNRILRDTIVFFRVSAMALPARLAASLEMVSRTEAARQCEVAIGELLREMAGSLERQLMASIEDKADTEAPPTEAAPKPPADRSIAATRRGKKGENANAAAERN